MLASDGIERSNAVMKLFAKAWPQARRIARKSFEWHGENVQPPVDCPYTLEQVLDADFLPGKLY